MDQVKVAFASGTDELNLELIAKMRGIYPELPLLVVSDFPPADRSLKWLPYYVNRRFRENLARCRWELRGKSIRLAGVMLVPNVPFRRMRLLALAMSPAGFIAFNENLDHFMLRPRSVPAIVRHFVWRTRNLARSLLKGGAVKEVPLPKVAEEVAVFAGRPASGKPRVLVASCYTIFPLSHGGAVRMYNLMRRAAADFDQVLIAFVDEIAEPAREVLEICAEVVLVRREGSHALPSHGRPDVVEEFASEAFRGALRAAVKRWQPGVAQLEFTQMAQYAADCAPARTILVEHDITFDLYEQMLAAEDDWEVRRQLGLWRKFERNAWKRVDRVVTMSERDRRVVAGVVGDKAVMLPNGVDLQRFRPAGVMPEPRRILFIGSFAHLPNLMALEFFLTEVWRRLEHAALHVIAGSRHEYYLDFYRDRVTLDLAGPGLEVEGFVSDVRPAYARAEVVVAPLVASAGTNIKVLEAMAMGRAVVSTAAGIHGLNLSPGKDVLLAETGREMAEAISRLFADAEARQRMERAARETVEREFGWDAIARRQADLYSEMCASSFSTTTS